MFAPFIHASTACDIHLANHVGRTALMEAAWGGQPAAIAFLITHGPRFIYDTAMLTSDSLRDKLLVFATQNR